MPLRLLERVLPWLFSELSDEDADGMMTNLRLGAPAVDQQLVELLLRWAQRGRWPVLPGVVAVAGTAAAAAGGGEGAVEQARVQQEQQGMELPQQQQGQVVEGGGGTTPAEGDEAVSAAVIDDLCTSCDASVTLNAAAGAAAEQQAGETQSAQQQPQQQEVGLTGQLRLHRQGSPSWSSYDPCLFGNNTCELRLLNQGGGSGMSPRKRQKLDRQGSPPDSSSTDATPTAAQAAVNAANTAAGAALRDPGCAGAAGLHSGVPGAVGLAHAAVLGSVVVGTGPGAVQQSAGHAAAAAAAAAGGQCIVGGQHATGWSPIDHIFQFHKALRWVIDGVEVWSVVYNT
jgi:hypothetical protein